MDNYKHTISMKLELTEGDCENIKNLETICYDEQKYNLKLELDYKMRHLKDSIKDKIMKEFLYYENEILVGYLGLCNFHGTSVEISGMVHPKFRRKGIFKKLYLLAKEEWKNIEPSEVLILCDHTSISGLAFIDDIRAEYGFSEYKMCLNKKTLEVTDDFATKLRLATNVDADEINRQSSIYFGEAEQEADIKEDKENPSIEIDDNFNSYMAEVKGEIIGKIHICITKGEGFIYGVGVLPKFRGRGYGREILCSALSILKEKNIKNIFLEVGTENKIAIELYESCGFEEISVMDYYLVS
ncbi:GNAT family N-acetyltransferase [Clostridium sp.]|uniref:GNAT family N-acetyltransferase n=1 Tax=Clostridium sp. TaxID=1506 RepID=UPI003D6D2C00